MNREPAQPSTSDGQVTLPASFAQQRLWFIDQLMPGSGAYNVPTCLRLRGELNPEALHGALTDLVARHEVLRTTFPVVDGEPWQLIAAQQAVAVRTTDLAARPDAERALWDLIGAASRRAFDLATGPLMRVELVRLSDHDHVLLVLLHHIVSDGWSVEVLHRELGILYGARVRAEPSPLPPLPIQYGDFAVWQREQLGGGVLDREIAWWRGQLDGVPDRLELPADYPAPAVADLTGATHTFPLPKATWRRVLAVARERRTTPFVVLLAVYAVLLGRITGQSDLLIGTTTAGRDRAELAELIGFFVNTVPIRVTFDAHGTPADVLDRVRRTTVEALARPELPFDKLVEASRPDRSATTNPLVQTVFSMEYRSSAPPGFPGLVAESLEAPSEYTKFDLSLTVESHGTAVQFGHFTYRTDLFEAATIATLADRYRRLLDAFLSVPDTPLWNLPLLDPGERRLLTCAWSSPAAPIPGAPGLHLLLARACVENPHALAVDTGETQLTHAELQSAANRLANLLRTLGAGPEVVVGVCLPRGAGLVTAMLGILVADAAYMPLDPAHPAGRIATMIEQAGAGLVVTTRELVGLLPPAARPVFADGLDLSGQPDSAPPSAVHPSQLAYVLFTSGSTGMPKPVGIPHRAVVNHAVAIRDRYSLVATDRVLQFASAGFDVAAEELFPTWLAGGCAVLLTDPALSPAAFTRLLDGNRVTVANLPASYWRQWTREAVGPGSHQAPAPQLTRAAAGPGRAAAVPGRGAAGPQREPAPGGPGRGAVGPGREPALGGLRLVVVGSEPVDLATVAYWYEHTGIPLANAYGVTEATVTSTVDDVDGQGPGVPIGRPIAGVQTYVLDSELQPVPPGVLGELYLGGAGLARGYLGRGGLTAGRFIPHPFAEQPGERLYRTGDRVRWRRDGRLEFLDRDDDQLNVRGYRVEPAEVETALRSHPGVQAAVASIRPAPDGEGRLVAYVVPSQAGRISAAVLRTHLAESLPPYLVPSSFVLVDRIPYTANHKVDREALAALEATVGAGVAHAQPVTGTERRLVALWRDLLGVERVGVNDNFFDLGGHSLLMARLRSRLEEAFDTELPMVVLYEHPTVAALARYLAEPDDQPQATGHRSPADPARLRLRRRRTLAENPLPADRLAENRPGADGLAEDLPGADRLAEDRRCEDRLPADRLAGDRLGADRLAVDPLGEGPLDEGPRERSVTMSDDCIHTRFEWQALERPEAIAVVGAGIRLTYRQLNERANRLAWHLVAIGVRVDQPVAVLLDRSADYVVAVLAILKAGAGYVPLDTANPSARLARLLTETAVSCVVTNSNLAGRVPAGLLTVEVDRLDDLARLPSANLDLAVRPDNLAYLMFTSGSTGGPKGVMVPHRAVIRLISGAGYARLGPGETLALVSSIAFDASTFEIWGALLTGGRLAVAAARSLSAGELGALIREHEVTTLWLTAGLFHLMVDENIEDLRGVRQLLAGGDTLDPKRVHRAVTELAGCQVINGYGPTEGTTFTTCYQVPGDVSPIDPVPIGRPVGGTIVRILDDHLQLVPVGVPGQLYAGGDGLARGYFGDAALTASRFVPDPYAATPGARLYATGDRARYRADGMVEFLGRIDQQVKIRGFRVEPGEIEDVLRTHPLVRDVVVIPSGDDAGSRRLVAYPVLERSIAGTVAEDLRDWLRQRLPGHLVPDLWAPVDVLPLNSNGKIDRRALPDPVAPGHRAYAEATAPGEQTIAMIWVEVLGVDRVGVHDDFFALGGHSLLASKVVARLRRELGVEVPLSTVFDHPTVAGLAAAIRAA